MIKKTIEGKEFYCFDVSELEAKREFEKAMVSEHSIRKLTLALIDAASEMEVQKNKAWQSAKELVAQESDKLDITDCEIEYNWILGGFSIKSSKKL